MYEAEEVATAAACSTTLEQSVEAARREYQRTVDVYLRTLWEVLSVVSERAVDGGKAVPGENTARPAVRDTRRHPTLGLSLKEATALLRRHAPAPSSAARLHSGVGRRVVSPIIQKSAVRQATPSTRSAAFAAVLESTEAPTPAAEGPEAVHRDVPPPLQSSVALLIADFGVQRALLRFSLRYLRCHAAERRRVRAEVALRYQFYRQRRVFHRWRQCVAMQRERLQEIVTVWQHFCFTQQHSRAQFHAFVSGLQQRSASWQAIERRRVTPLWHHWRRRVGARQYERCLMSVVQAFREQREPCGTPAVLLGLPLPCSSAAALKSHLLSYWKCRTERQLTLRLADWIGRVRLFRRTFVRVRERFGALAQTSADGALLPVTQRSTLIRTFVIPSATLHPALAAVKLRDKARSVLRMLGLRTAHRTWTTWRHAFLRRQADRFCVQRTRRAVMLQWMTALVRRRECRAACRVVWSRWRQRAEDQRQHRLADRFRFLNLLSRWMGFWRHRWAARVVAKAAVVGSCWQRWKRRGLAQRLERLRCRPRLEMAWKCWKARVVHAQQCRTYTVLADTIRHTVALTFCFRRWCGRKKMAERAQLKLRILRDLQNDRLQAQCFGRWKQRYRMPATDLLLGHEEE